MTETTLTALTKAWVTTVIASALFCTTLAIAQIWNGAVYLGALPQALSLAGETPDPSVELWTAGISGDPAAVAKENGKPNSGRGASNDRRGPNCRATGSGPTIHIASAAAAVG